MYKTKVKVKAELTWIDQWVQGNICKICIDFKFNNGFWIICNFLVCVDKGAGKCAYRHRMNLKLYV